MQLVLVWKPKKKKKLKNKIVLKNNHKLLNKMKLVVNKFILLRYDFINIAYTYICVNSYMFELLNCFSVSNIFIKPNCPFTASKKSSMCHLPFKK